ncbi:MAG: tetratricopeptide repeat protein [Anaerolineae bacterium]|nr:tetratricopeptide repeat protein [Anaerolineae bacterium]
MMSSAHHNSNLQGSGGSGLIVRQRLIDKLSQAVDHKLTLISAPPGYGKTTLATQFMRQANLPVVWHTIEPSQRDVPVLHHRALSILEPLAPGIQNLPTAYGNPPIELATHIAEYLREYLTSQIIYIFDDTQHLAGSLPAETWLRTLVTQLPAKLHVVIISRVLPDLPLTEMIARREVLAIGQEELKFRRDEIHSLATRIRGKPPTPTEVEDWEVRLEGWPAGTILALQPLPKDLERVMLRGGVGPEALFSDLARSMLQAQPRDVRDFLLASSTLVRLTPELCTEALQIPDAMAMLVQALNRNMFVARVTGGLAYHSLFRDFLQKQLKETNQKLFRSLHARAAEWFEKQDQIIEAVDHYLTAGQVQHAVVLVERVCETYFVQGKVETLLEWWSRLKRAKSEIPRLLCTCAKIHIDRYNYDVAQIELGHAEQTFAAQENAQGIAEVQILLAMLHLQRGDYEQAVDLASDFLATDLDIAHLHGRALTILGTAQINLGNIVEATRYLEEALPIYRADGDAFALSKVLQTLEVAYSGLGRLSDSAACLQEVVALRRKLGNTGALALALNNLGVHYHQYSDYQRALATFQEGLSVVARVANNRAESYLLWSLGDLQRDRGAYDESHQLYRRSLEINDTNEPYLTSSVLISMSTLERWQGNFRDAISLATEAAALAEKYHLGILKSQAQAAIWSARLSTEAAQAYTKLVQIATQVRASGLQMELIQILALCAQAALRVSNTSAAQDHLEDALEIASELESAQPLAAEMLRAPTLEALIKPRQARYKWIVDALKRLSESRYSAPTAIEKPLVAALNQDTYKLRVLTLGQEGVERDGVRVSTSDWRANAARELFFYLLFCGPVTREDINLEFWPDSTSSRARSRFHTTLYRARHALGESIIVYQDDRYQLNPQTEIWCDAQEVETLITQARLLSPRDARTEDLWRKAVTLYHGEFLAGMDREWAISRRENLHEAYIEALIGVGECARARGDFRAAVSAFKDAVDLEPYREDINRAIMICYADLGEKHQIRTHLHKLRELLRQDLAVEPSPETIELANRLLA